MIYHLISDDVFFLCGASKILKTVVNEGSITSNNININGWKKTKKEISKKPFQKIIIYMHCFRKRRRLLRLAAAHDINVIVFTRFKDDCDNKHNSFIKSSLCSKEDFLFSLLNGRELIEKRQSLTSQKIIKMLSSGISISELSKKLGLSQKMIYATKNNTIRNFGLTTTKLHGLLLCRDILEMKSINLRCKNRMNHKNTLIQRAN
ncbi:hypothetical protein [Klebsiella oxytoca]|uniref:hypothetical protein n=1 Tax=Klebsiella oxytoca TaxID=571 RepID=UPI0039C90E1E